MKYDLSQESKITDLMLLLDQYAKEGKTIEVNVVREKRSLNQNAYFHVCIGIFAKETGYTVTEMKKIIYREVDFMNHVKPNLSGELEIFEDSSADLDTLQMTILIDYVRNRALEMGIYIPTVEEYLQNQLEIDNYLKHAI